MNVEFRIINRGTMIVYYGDKKAIIQGEGTYYPLIFYVWTKSFVKWESPYENIPITDKEKEEIINYIILHSEELYKIKVIFE
jgi:hypothetical protein